MIDTKVELKPKKNLVPDLKASYATALKDPKFSALVNNLKIKESVAIKYTTNLEETVDNLNKCSNCKGLMSCKNKMEGFVYFPNVKNDRLIFSYIVCKYKKKAIEKESEVNNGIISEIANASMKDIDITDKKRTKVIKWLKDFYTNYQKNKKIKGLYLHGSFGSGKTYLIAAMFNELAKKRVQTEIIYYPEMLRDLKGDFDNYAEKLDYYQNVDILLIDDIGAEKVTEWSRDEVLGTILQNRMNNHLATFFTSNLSLSELENHLCITSSSEDKVKARRIIQRIMQLTDELELISVNRRN